MALQEVAKHIALNALAADLDFLSLHSAYSTAGANEATGGTPPYARKGTTWGGASGATVSISSPQIFDVPPMTVAFVGTWSLDTGGTFYGMFPLGGTGYREFQTDVTNNTILSEGHSYVDGNQIVFISGAPPAPLTEGTIYFVVNAAASETFKVAATAGGAAIDLTSDGGAEVRVSNIVAETFAAQGQYSVNSLSISWF